jgi:hypothetical protein
MTAHRRGLYVSSRACCILLLVLAASALFFPMRGTAQLPDPGDGGKADDAVRRAILSGPTVPRTILEVRQRLVSELKGKLRPHIVVNGGHDNPTRGRVTEGVKFMVFETYEGPPDVAAGELFIGYFLEPRADKALEVQRGFIELIAWDRTKQVFNFWEVLDPRWFYRGDSRDVLRDVAQLNIGANNPQFPTPPRLRCSGCHTLGAPIMKELEPPHNDWWTTDRRLTVTPYILKPGTSATDPTHVASSLFRDAADASNLSQQVKHSIDRLILARMKAGADGLTVKQQLRSLFGTMEMNLVSDSAPLADPARTVVELPQDFFVDARLVGNRQPVQVSVEIYRKALQRVGSQFAPDETPGLPDSHHAFVVPARSYIDNRVIDALMTQGLLDEELVADVLAIDLTTPVYSISRASLIKYVPEQASDVTDLRAQLVAALRQAPEQDQAAHELLVNLTDPARTAEAHRQAARAYLDACARAAGELDTVVDWLTLASQRRRELVTAETAQHPDGNIKEEGFRVIFPQDQLNPKPGELRLHPATARAVRNP